MLLALPFPEISPEIFSVSLGPVTLALRWYALAYIVGLLIGWKMVASLMRRPRLWGTEDTPMSPEAVERLLTWVILGVVIGGRLGFVLFYDPARYLANPMDALRIWDGGMSFHGGFAGVVLAVALFARVEGVRLSALSDAIAYAAPPGILLGRLANFINAELWGKPTDMPWGVVFPRLCVDPVRQLCEAGRWFYLPDEPARHPSQLYEAALEGLLLGLLLLVMVHVMRSLRRGWLVTGVFLVGYGLARMFVELFRLADRQFITPDNPYGHVIGGLEFGLTMGQLLSAPMLLVGLALISLSMLRRQ